MSQPQSARVCPWADCRVTNERAGVCGARWGRAGPCVLESSVNDCKLLIPQELGGVGSFSGECIYVDLRLLGQAYARETIFLRDF